MGLMAAVEDVKRYLVNPDIEVDYPEIVPFLQAADDWARGYLHASYGEAQKSETFYRVREDGVVTVQDKAPTSVTVTIYDDSSSSGRAMTEGQDYTVSGGRIKFLSTLIGIDWQIGGEGAIYQRVPTVFHHVVVTYTPAASIPPAVREAVAELAAWHFAGRDQVQGQLSSERLGDYSYSRSQDTTKPIPESVRRKLRRYRTTPVYST